MIKHGDTEERSLTETPHNALTEKVIGAAIEVHRILGPGLLESAYESCLCRELALLGCQVERQVFVDLVYKSQRFEKAYRIDLIVDQTVLVEVKAVEELAAVYKLQMLTYLKLTSKPVGLVINFNVPILWKGVRRVLNNH